MSCNGVAGEERLDEPNDVDERAAAEEVVDEAAAAAGEVAVEAEKDAAKLRAVRCPLSRLLSSSSRSCGLDRLVAVVRAGDGDATRVAEPCACAEERAVIGAGEAAAAAAAAAATAARECVIVVAEYLGASVCLMGGDGGTRIWKWSKSSSVSLSLLYAKEDVAVAAAAEAGGEGAGPRAGDGAAERGVCASACAGEDAAAA